MKENKVKKIKNVYIHIIDNKITLIVLIITIIILLILSGLAILFINSEKEYNINGILKREESMRDITFDVYSNENDILKILVVVEDTENGINKLIYRSEQGGEKEIICQGKTKVALDYEVRNDGNYEFKMIDRNNEEFSKTLRVDQDFRNNLIDINVDIEADKTIATHGKVTIDYHGREDKKRMYKIGENGVWKDYNESFEIDAYQIIENKWINSTTKELTIYSKIEDNAKNIVQIEKNITNIDIDIANEPQINILSVEEYPTLTKDGMKNHSEISIDYDNREDITNYYSVDNGKTWNIYDQKLTFDFAAAINAKSVKNNSGLEISKKVFINAYAVDALLAVTYDDDVDTHTTSPYIGSSWAGSTTMFFKVSSEVSGNYFRYCGYSGGGYYAPSTCSIDYIDKSGNGVNIATFRFWDDRY